MYIQHVNVQIENNRSESIQNNSGMSLAESTCTANNLKPPPLVTPNSDGTSFLTARSKNTNASSSSAFTPIYSSSTQRNEEEEEDYGFDYTSDLTENTKDQTKALIKDDNASITTVKPTKKNPIMSLTSRLPLTTTAISPNMAEPITAINQKKQRRRHRLDSKSLLWKRAGSLFVPRKPINLSEFQVPQPTGATIKRGPVVSMRTVTDRLGSEPTRYKASKESRYNLLMEKWKQVELVLTRSYISTYSSSTFFWPKHRLESRIHFEGSRKPKDLELFLFSPVDYTFGLRFSSNSGKIPTTVVMMFKARTFLQCQEWYMQLYKVLPANAKRPFPSYCEVYIPLLELTLNLPLEETEGCYDITLSDVKNAVMTVIEADGRENKLSCVDDEELCLCWATKERAEWVHWSHSFVHPEQRIDWAICPQSIEQTHRLELRVIEHSPYDILLEEGVTLKEPPPVEGLLLCTSNFFGLTTKIAKKPQYFASFDQYLFYVPSLKVTEPDVTCVMDEELVSENLRLLPHVSIISPYTTHTTEEIELEETQRRMKLLAEAKGLIDLTEVSYVRRRFNDLSEHENISESSQTHILGSNQKKKGMISRENLSCTLELIMDNGLSVQFQTYSVQTCDVWTNYLSQLVLYWKARKEAKREAHLNKQFADSLINEKDDLIEGCLHSKEKKVADTRIWSYCLYEQCRGVVKSGILYYKPHHRGTYSKKFFILAANGWLLFFDVYNRIRKSKPNNHERKGAIDTAGCYFYSGVDCSKKRKGSNMARIYEHYTKAYPSGLITGDTLMTCVFSIWKPMLRKYFSPKQQRLRVYHQDQRLNSEGQNIMFLAESRQEKEEWIFALNSVAEHMMRASS
ncbi:unnamed protein product [Rhizopus stolonifer]